MGKVAYLSTNMVAASAPRPGKASCEVAGSYGCSSVVSSKPGGTVHTNHHNITASQQRING